MSKITSERALTIDILAEFEELLESQGISIPDEDRKGEDCEARLYGQTYYDLEDKITDLICKCVERRGIQHDGSFNDTW